MRPAAYFTNMGKFAESQKFLPERVIFNNK